MNRAFHEHFIMRQDLWEELRKLQSMKVLLHGFMKILQSTSGIKQAEIRSVSSREKTSPSVGRTIKAIKASLMMGINYYLFLIQEPRKELMKYLKISSVVELYIVVLFMTAEGQDCVDSLS